MLIARKNAGKELRKASKESLSCYKNPREMATNLGIGGTTFRAFTNFGQPPSEIYRDWVHAKGYQLVEKNPLASRKDFLSLHGQLVKSFKNYCKRFGCRELSISETNKVVDLFTKVLAFRTDHPCEQQRKGLYKYANIPLDKFSLIAIRELFYGIVLSKNPSMGDIKHTETYDFLQSQIFQLTSSLDVPNLVFDFYAWNMSRSQTSGRCP
jgi:hypothetical protein